MKSVKLQKVHLLNYKGISEIKAEINGNHFIVFGKNGAGKTSLTEVINRAALRIDPKKMAEIPIKIGSKNASVGIVYEINDNGKKRRVLVETTYRPSGTVTKLIDLESEGELKPFQEKLKTFIGETIDITELLFLDGKKQIDYLKKIGLSIDIEQEEKQIKNAYAERRFINNQIKQKKATLSYNNEFKKFSDPNFQPIEKPIEPSIEILKNKVIANKKIDEQHQKIDDAIVALENQIKSLQEQIESYKVIKKELPVYNEIEHQQFLTEIENFNTVIIPKYQEELEIYNTEQKQIADYNYYLLRKKEIEQYQTDAISKTETIKKAKKAIGEKISTINLQEIAPELAIKYNLSDEIDNADDAENSEENIEQIGIYYCENDILLPFNLRQISYGKALVALMKLQSFVNKDKLNLFHIPQWNELDENSKQDLLKFAELHPEYNIQFCIEEVKNTLLGLRILEKNG